MKYKLFYMLLLIPILIFLLFGCSSHHDNNMMSNNTNTSFAALIFPANGTVDVSTASSVSLKFVTRMDTSSVMDNFHLAGGDGMHLWMDSVTHSGGMGNMSMEKMNHLMNWIDSIQIQGTFHWNSTMDSCEFIPSDSMLSNTDYMIFMDENNMMNRDGSMMGSNMNHHNNGYHQYHFKTGL